MFALSAATVSLLALIVVGEENGKCAYSAMGMIAVPLGSCSVYSMEETTSMSYSSDYSYEGTTLNWNYYTGLDCRGESKTYEMDEVMQGIHHLNLQLDGEGSNCNTVDVRVSGSYSELTEGCDSSVNTNDFYSRSYVVDECISSEMEGYSSKLMCDDEKIYFNYYAECTDCSCKMEQYVYQYYADKGADCYDVTCRSRNDVISALSSSAMVQKPDTFLKMHLFTQNPNTPLTPILAQKIGIIQSNKQLVDSGILSAESIYVAGGVFLFIIFCGICRYINSFKKEYAQI